MFKTTKSFTRSKRDKRAAHADAARRGLWRMEEGRKGLFIAIVEEGRRDMPDGRTQEAGAGGG